LYCHWSFAGTSSGQYKKTLRAAEQEPPDVNARRTSWREDQASLRPERLVFVDETWTTTNMARRYDRPAKGRRLICASPMGIG
jgi:hypothetical protein